MGMYTQTGGVPPVGTPQGMMHQQSPQMHQGQQQPPPNSQNTQASLPSPLYPWMRSQFGKFFPASCICFSGPDQNPVENLIFTKTKKKNFVYRQSYAKVRTLAQQAAFEIPFHLLSSVCCVFSLPKKLYSNCGQKQKRNEISLEP